jgi:hypothetical protein
MTVLLLAASPAGARNHRDEEFRYRWRLTNLMGTVAGLFLPNSGEGSLSIKTQENGNLKTELLITSPKSKEGEYWRYGSEIDPESLRALRAWSDYTFRGESKSKNERIRQKDVLDIASGIYSIRRNPPAKPRRMEIWSDGRVYQVVVTPGGEEMRQLPGGAVKARQYTIRGVPGAGRRWKGKLDLWLAADEAATPVEIRISRNLADVHLQLVEPVG